MKGRETYNKIVSKVNGLSAYQKPMSEEYEKNWDLIDWSIPLEKEDNIDEVK